MSDAKVKFSQLDSLEAMPGSEQTFGFDCPKHDRRREGLVIAGKTELARDPQGKNGGIAQWDWDHNRETPSFAPSINCGGCWHGYIRSGRAVDCQGNEEPEIKRERT